jgi:hypothetical protein
LKELEQKFNEQQISKPVEEVKPEKKVRQRLRGGRRVPPANLLELNYFC